LKKQLDKNYYFIFFLQTAAAADAIACSAFRIIPECRNAKLETTI